ncbi:hypothetical protein [Cryptosporangium minutisporangium]|uniref:Uncharacterized protein n=1 Tax=Cryptosporangium minutisporangium TaxID=113569 RepID=A0ABP6T460_9ACTN
MTANPSEADRNAETAAPHVDDLDTDPHHDALSSDNDPVVDDADTRSPAEIAEEREERSVDAGPHADPHADQRPTIPAVPKPVVPAVAGILAFVLLAFPFGWTIAGAVIGGLVAAAVSYAFVFRL